MTLLATKLYIPPVRPGLVPRPRLTGRLNEGLGCKLTLISAPAGFGKTTLVSEWSQQVKRPVAWLSLDRGDNDPVHFWQYVVAALQTADDSIGLTAQTALQSPQPPALEPLVTALINDLAASAQPLILVLDDYHVIEAKEIHSSLDFLLDHLPSQLRLVIATRSDPPLSLPRRRGRSELVEVRMAHLRFTIEEAAEFLNTCMGLDISAEDVAALENRVEGWIVGLQMAALTMKTPSFLQEGGASRRHEFVVAFAGDDRHIADYLLEEVLQRQPAHVQAFLLQTSILERLCGPLCDAVTGRSDGQAILAALEQANLFIVPLDNRRQWYRYHALFADLLRWRLRQPPSACAGEEAGIEALHLRASRWYEREGFVTDAISHALAATDFEYTADLIDRHVLAALLRSDAPLAHSWMEALPEDLLRTRPTLCAFYAISTLLAPPFGPKAAKLAEEWIREAEEALAAQASQAYGQGVPDQAARDTLAACVATFRAYQARIRGDASQTVVELSLRALDCLPKDEVQIRSTLVLNLGFAHMALDHEEAAGRAFAEARQLAEACDSFYVACLAIYCQVVLARKYGRLHEAAAICREALQSVGGSIGPGERPVPALGVLYIALGRILLEWNDLQGADHALTRGLELNALTQEWQCQATGYAALSRLRQAQGDLAASSATLERARASLPRAAPWISRAQAALWLAQAEDDPRCLAAAARWVQEHQVDFRTAPISLRRESSIDNEELILARLLIAQRRAHQSASMPSAQGPIDLQPLLRFLGEQLQRAEKGGWIEWVVRISILQALALQALDEFPQALDSLERALVLAEPGGYTRIFVDEGAAMAALLCRVEARGVAPAYAGKLLAAFGRPAEGKVKEPGAPSLVEPLTRREIEVLQLIAAGSSNPQIAQELFITVNTVKRHVTNILGKLEVDNRTQAAVRARELGLVE